MKSINHIFVFIFLLFIMISCSSTKQLAIGVVEPAKVKLPQVMKRIGVVQNVPENGSVDQPSKGIAGLVSQDDAFLAQKGMDAALDGLLIKLLQDPRFDTIIKLSDSGRFMELEQGQPTEASWQNIRSFCERYGLDAVFSLDHYQADTRYTLKKAKIYERDIIRNEVAKKGHQLTLETLIENGWKIYDPFQKQVLDEFNFKEQIITTATGISPIRAYRSMGSLQDSLVMKSKGSGDALGSRLQPSETKIYRSYYSKGSDRLVAAHKKIVEEDWSGAITLYKEELSYSRNKVQSMSCHNLAVIHEYLQDLNEARQWAEKAHEFNPTKKSQSYIEVLDLRIAQKLEVAEQLSFLGR